YFKGNKKINEVNSIPLYKKDRGMCIGSMQSQILAVFFLDSIIHFIKENLKYNEVLSYVDDIIILSTDKQKILKDKILIEKEINNIGLLLNKKSNIYRLTKGIEFLGYRYSIKNNYIYIKYNINTLNRIKRNLRNLKLNNNLKYILSKNSYKGYFLVSNTSLKNNFII
ncbi:MAG: reverse transcriptase domain-containing protein, partial [Bacilli bacterium]